MNKSRISIIAVMLSMGASADVSAESIWYAGISVGNASTDVSRGALDDVRDSVLFLQASTRNVATTFDESSTTWSVFGGRRITRFLAIEAAYVRLGDISYRAEGEFATGGFFGGGPYIPSPGSAIYYPGSSVTLDIEHSAITFKLVGRLPIAERFDVHMQAGAVHAMTNTSYSTSITSNPSIQRSRDADSNATDLLYGVGATFNLAPRWDLSLDWHRYEVKEDDRSPFDLETSYDTITLGLIFGFGAAQ